MIELKNIAIWFAAFMLLLMVGIAAASPGITMVATPHDSEVLPGETATYDVEVSYFLQDPPSESVVLSIDNPIWSSYTFNPATFTITTGDEITSVLSIDVPTDAQPDTYEHIIKGTATAEDITEVVTTTVETAVIPEFTTMAIPVAAIFGILLLIRRRKQQ